MSLIAGKCSLGAIVRLLRLVSKNTCYNTRLAALLPTHVCIATNSTVEGKIDEFAAAIDRAIEGIICTNSCGKVACRNYVIVI
ncbi:MAG: hypothetical protein MUE44_22555 [Oscillatoriaceae cyanobacterium Prado104]|nr:hypothetical protein [Oscillatoriaceae cyanobacterium Prado104]